MRFLFLAFPFIFASSTYGAILLTATETSEGVSLVWLGSLGQVGDLEPITLPGFSHGTLLANGGIGIGPDIEGSTAAIDTCLLGNWSGPTSIGPGQSQFFSDSGSGDYLGIQFPPLPGTAAGAVSFLSGYLPGSELTGSSQFEGESFESMGINIGRYEWTWANGGDVGKFSLHVIPEPGTAVILLASLISAVVTGRRKFQMAYHGCLTPSDCGMSHQNSSTILWLDSRSSSNLSAERPGPDILIYFIRLLEA